MKQVGDEKNMRDVLDRIPAKYIDAMENNPKLNACCKKAKEHKVTLFQTDDALPGPDIMVMECKTCGRKHRRMAMGGAKAQL